MALLPEMLGLQGTSASWHSSESPLSNPQVSSRPRALLLLPLDDRPLCAAPPWLLQRQVEKAGSDDSWRIGDFMRHDQMPAFTVDTAAASYSPPYYR